MKPDKVRVIAVCVFRDGDRILAAEGFDTIKQQTFYRPLGGTVEFGERSEDTVRREMMEEIRAEVTDLRYLGTLENIFIFDGQKGHELVQVYDGAFVDRTFYKRNAIQGDELGTMFRAVWIDLKQVGPGFPPLYPTGLAEMLSEYKKSPA